MFIDCNCIEEGSVGNKCDEIGQCNCKRHFEGLKCSRCKQYFFGFPSCKGNINDKSFNS